MASLRSATLLLVVVVASTMIECAPNAYPSGHHFNRQNPFVHHHNNPQSTQSSVSVSNSGGGHIPQAQNHRASYFDGRVNRNNPSSQHPSTITTTTNNNNHHRNPIDGNFQHYPPSLSSSNIGGSAASSHPQHTVIAQIVNEVRNKLKTHADQFDDFFRNLLRVSHYNFHKMFSDTYGILYDRHAAIFNDMFRDLETYYTHGKLDISVAMKNFFATLYKKMFEELNSQFAFDARYLNCTVEHMEEMMPFGELPAKLISQIRRSFVAVRTFIQALNYGSDILRTIADAPLTSVCQSHLQTVRDSRRICAETCVASIEQACFPYLPNLNRDWNLYLNDVLKLASRLKTSFNIELAVKPINIQISEAIMTFQESGVLISQTLFNKCGKPTSQNQMRRSKRDLYMYNGSNSGQQQQQQQPKVYSSGSYRHHSSTPSLPPSASSLAPHQQGARTAMSSPKRNEISMEQLIGDIVRDFKSYKNFWPLLPKRICAQLPHGQAGSCSAHLTNSGQSVPSYRDRNNLEIVNRQTLVLRAVSQNLKNAFNGFDVDPTNNLKMAESETVNVPSSDDDDDDDDAVGHIAGSGSNRPDDEEEDDDDFDEGSGSGDRELIIDTDKSDAQVPPTSGEDFVFENKNRTTTTTTESSNEILEDIVGDSGAKVSPSSAPFVTSQPFSIFLTLFIVLFCSSLL